MYSLIPLDVAHDELLREEAASRGIDISQMDREEIITGLTQSGTRHLLISREPDGRKIDMFSLMFSLLSLVIAVGGLVVAISAARSANRQAIAARDAADATQTQAVTAVKELNSQLAKANEDAKSLEIEEWQELVVYRIIDNAFRESRYAKGPTFAEIDDAYVTAAAKSTLEVPREKLADDELYGILLNLQRSGLIYKTNEERYATDRAALNPDFGRSTLVDAARADVYSMISLEPGRYSLDDLSKIIPDKHKVTQVEFTFMMTNLVISNAIKADEKGRFSSVLHTPMPDSSGSTDNDNLE